MRRRESGTKEGNKRKRKTEKRKKGTAKGK